MSGTGTSGSRKIALKAGFTGKLDVTTHGLAKSTTVADSVAAGKDDFQCVTVTDHTSLARFQVDVQDNSADLDLEVLAATSCDIDTAFASAGISGTASGDEAVTLRRPPAGTYIAVVSGFSAGTSGSPMAYDFDFWDINPGASAGALKVQPDPVKVRKNTTTSVNVTAFVVVNPNPRSQFSTRTSSAQQS